MIIGAGYGRIPGLNFHCKLRSRLMWLRAGLADTGCFILPTTASDLSTAHWIADKIAGKQVCAMQCLSGPCTKIIKSLIASDNRVPDSTSQQPVPVCTLRCEMAKAPRLVPLSLVVAASYNDVNLLSPANDQE